MSPVQPSEVLWYLSNPGGSSGFSGTGMAGNSLGKYMSTTQVTGAIDDLFLDLNGTQNASGQVDYQCIFLMNNTVTGFYLKNPFAWFPLPFWTNGGAGLSVAVDPLGPVPYNSAGIQAGVIGSVLTVPPGITKWSPGPQAVFTAGLAIPDVPPQFCVALWVQRTATNSPVFTPQTLQLTCTYTSDA